MDFDEENNKEPLATVVNWSKEHGVSDAVKSK
uniref:Uncharacterized protein n=1 Tax=Romanomermis culicivorax TaxID=13658 RepID=A0A915IKR3_ROMCU